VPALLLLALAITAPAPPPIDPLADGLKLWRKPGQIQGGAACATCHSPDGIEIAAYAFDDADIERRAMPHLGAHDAQRVVAFIHAVRRKYGFTRLRDPDRDRPLQPGGTSLPGTDPATRDFAFGVELQPRLPTLFGGRIEAEQAARRAERELLALDPNTLRIGFSLNPLSEDVAHGNVHSSIAQWLPEEPPAVPPASVEAWYAAEDAYLSHSSSAALAGLISLHTRLVDTSRMLGLGELSAAKFRALLVLQDRIRRRTEGHTGTVAPDVAKLGNYNPIWQVGEIARQVIGRGPNELGMGSATQSAKLAGPPLAEQLRRLRLSWFWAGWLSDQGLFKTSHDDKTRLGMWFSESLSKDGPYPIHSVYANARRQAVVSNDPSAWGETLARRRRIWDFAGLRSFQEYVTDIPREPRHRRLYLRFTLNCFRMNLLLLKADIEHTHQVWIKLSAKANVAELAGFIKAQDPAGAPLADRLRDDLDRLIDQADERR